MKKPKKLAKETRLGWGYLRRNGRFSQCQHGTIIGKSRQRALKACLEDETVVPVKVTIEQVR